MIKMLSEIMSVCMLKVNEEKLVVLCSYGNTDVPRMNVRRVEPLVGVHNN